MSGQCGRPREGASSPFQLWAIGPTYQDRHTSTGRDGGVVLSSLLVHLLPFYLWMTWGDTISCHFLFLSPLMNANKWYTREWYKRTNGIPENIPWLTYICSYLAKSKCLLISIINCLQGDLEVLFCLFGGFMSFCQKKALPSSIILGGLPGSQCVWVFVFLIVNPWKTIEHTQERKVGKMPENSVHSPLAQWCDVQIAPWVLEMTACWVHDR